MNLLKDNMNSLIYSIKYLRLVRVHYYCWYKIYRLDSGVWAGY